jgi:DNA-binding transcriptional regulator of glucitol operon
MLTNQSSGVTRMGLLNRDRHVDEDRVLRDDEVVDRPADRNRYARSVVRALFTLAGVAVAGLLIWIASNFDLGQTSEFWAVMGLLAGAGLALGLSQLLGGWTKWGVPRVSAAVLLLAWLPTLVAAGWILLAAQPTGGWQQSRFESWSDTIGILGFVRDQGPFAAAIALAFGVVTAFIFDTTGPRERHVERTRTVADEDVHDYRREDATIAVPTDRPTTTVDDRETVTTGARDDSVVPAGTRDDTVVRRDTP